MKEGGGGRAGKECSGWGATQVKTLRWKEFSRAEQGESKDAG